MDEETFKRRTRLFALAIIQVVESLPRTNVPQVIGKQLLRSGTSVGANYRAACRGKSALDVLAKLGIVEEEADESLYWLELMVEAGIVPPQRIDAIRKEANEILAMTVASSKTLRARKAYGDVAMANPKSKIQNPKSKIPTGVSCGRDGS